MKHADTIIKGKVTCDLCGSECEPVGTIREPARYYMDLVHHVEMRVSADIEYGPNDGDVCTECTIKAMERWIKQTRWAMERKAQA